MTIRVLSFVRLTVGTLAVLAATIAATRGEAKDVGGWNVDVGESACFMAAEFEDDVTIMIRWEPRLEEHDFVIYSPSWDSLRERDGEYMRLDLQLTGESLEYDKWWDESSLVIAFEDGSEGLLATWEREHALDFSVSFALATSVSIQAQGRTLGRYDLDGTYAAMKELRRCGSDQLRRGGDPFAQ